MARARRRLEGGARPRRADGEVLRVGKDGYRLFQNDEGESESTSLAVPLERSFCVSFLILSIHSHLHCKRRDVPSKAVFGCAM